MKGATADQIAGAYAQLTGAEAQLARLQRGADPAQIRAAEAGVKQAEVAVYLSQLQLDKATSRRPPTASSTSWMQWKAAWPGRAPLWPSFSRIP